MRYTRITVNPNQVGGVPCLRGLGIPVATVVDMVADGMSFDEILRQPLTLCAHTSDIPATSGFIRIDPEVQGETARFARADEPVELVAADSWNFRSERGRARIEAL